jgi:uncharacterized protein YcnI
MRQVENQYKCDKHNPELTVTETICANRSCKHKFKYLTHNIINQEILEKMKQIADNPDDFYANDSLFQYKDIVDLSVGEDLKIRPKCPKRHSPST